MKMFALGILVSVILLGVSTIAYDKLMRYRINNLNNLIEEMYEKQARDRYTIRDLYKEKNMAWFELNRIRRKCR